MKKKIILLASLVFIGIAVNAQVGVGTENPKTTLDVVGETTATVADGVLVPRFTVTQLAAKDAAYGADQNGTLVFVTSGTGTTGKTSEITGAGFHYYDSPTSKWKTIGGGGGGAAAPEAHNLFVRAGASYTALVPADVTAMNNTLYLNTSAPAGGFLLTPLSDADQGKILYVSSKTGSNISVNYADGEGIMQTKTLQNNTAVGFLSMGSLGWLRISF